jgi:hypothetical protein
MNGYILHVVICIARAVQTDSMVMMTTMMKGVKRIVKGVQFAKQRQMSPGPYSYPNKNTVFVFLTDYITL